MLLLAAISSAFAGVQLSAGVRDFLPESRHVDGVQAGVRIQPLPWLAGEAQVYFNPRTGVPSSLDTTLAVVANDAGSEGFASPFSNDRSSLALMADLGPGPCGGRLELCAGPHLYLGLDSRVVSNYAVSAASVETGEVSSLGNSMQLGPVVGLGVGAWMGRHLGLRLRAMSHLSMAPEPVYEVGVEAADRVLDRDREVSIDLLWAFGGER